MDDATLFRRPGRRLLDGSGMAVADVQIAIMKTWYFEGFNVRMRT